MIAVKVCGIKCAETAKSLSSLPVDYMGLIFVTSSSRYVTKDTAQEIIKVAPTKKWVGVFKNHDINEVIELANNLNLSVVQLHGEENVEYILSLRNSLLDVEIWKAIHVTKKEDIKQAEVYSDVVSKLLFDTGELVAGRAESGGSGMKFNWEILANFSHKIPFILAGGIGLSDVLEIKKFKIAMPNFSVVDINSKFELSAGVKDTKLIASFIKELNQ